MYSMAASIETATKGKDTSKLISHLHCIRTNIALEQSDTTQSFKFATLWLNVEEEKFQETTGESESQEKPVPTAELAAANDAMGVVYGIIGDHDEAKKFLKRSKRLRESMDGFKPAHNYSPLIALGINAWNEGKHEEAETFLLQALSDREAEYGEDDDSPRYDLSTPSLSSLPRTNQTPLYSLWSIYCNTINTPSARAASTSL